jgi:CheY-like chemotaxis protein
MAMGRRTILIVEDEADIRETLADAMRDLGADVAVASDGLDALERLREGACPAVILLDLRLPRLDGQEFLARLRADRRHDRVPVITMTAGTSRAEGDDIVARLSKPFDVGDLREIVESLIDADVAA